VPGSRFCGIPAHRELAAREAAGEELEASQVVGGVSDEPEEAAEPPVRDSGPVEGVSGEPGGSPGEDVSVGDGDVAEDAPIEAEVAAAPLPDNEEEVDAGAEPEAEEPPEAPVEAEVPVAVEETVAEGDQPSSA
jgi:hypothetical protein